MLSSLCRFCWSLFTFVLIFSAMAVVTCPVYGQGKTAHVIIPGYERLYSVPGADEHRAGQLLLGELNCTSCHQVKNEQSNYFLPKKAPILTNVGSRVKVSYLRKFLENPHKTKPGTAMPDVFAGLTDAERKEKVEPLVHLLASTGSLRHEALEHTIAGVGRKLYHDVGCVACHGSRNASGKPEKTTASSVPLANLASKYTIPSMSAFLANPHHSRPSGRMPGILDAAESRLVSHYLLQDIPAPPANVNYAYYEGGFGNLPDFKKLKPKVSGKASGFTLKAARRGNNYALKFETNLRIDREGDYTFFLRSDDGSRLVVDNKMVVNNDGTHPPQLRTGKAKLKKGNHPLVLTFFQAGGGIDLQAHIQGPGLGKQPLSHHIFLKPKAGVVKKKTPDEADKNFVVKKELVATGRKIFASMGCANCHQIKLDGQEIDSTAKPPALAKLKLNSGCLTVKPKKGSPLFSLNDKQRKLLANAVSDFQGPDLKKLTGGDRIHRTLATFNCYACHDRNKIGGPEKELEKFFTTVQPEMGDEGRIPPSLNGVGAKLKPDYFNYLLANGSNERPYMHTRMPKFGRENTGHVVQEFAKLDKLPAWKKAKFKVALSKVKTAGRYMVGSRAFGCIKCHTFSGHKAEGVQGIDMSILTKRLKYDWFNHYLLNPQKFRQGTRMPASWPEGQSQLAKVLDGDTHKQIEAIYVYLSAGNRASLPEGLVRAGMQLIPAGEAIIYRNFIAGGGSRAIAVGYPERLNVCFDANTMRLAMMWQGAFIDAKRHWTGRGQGYQPPLGDNVLNLPGNSPFTVLEKADQPWPNQAPKSLGYKFRGYRLTEDQRPTFLYSFKDLSVEDFPNPVEKGLEVSMKRTFTVSAKQPIKNLYYRAAAGNAIEEKNGWYIIDGKLRVRIQSTAPPQIRQIGNAKELIVPVAFKGNQAKIVQEYDW